MWEHNSDGAGYAFVGKRGKVHFKKGFMTLEELLADLEPQREKLKHKYFAIHFRIGTSGKNDKHTTHPFPISTEFGQLRKLEGEEDAVLFHNGVLGAGKIINDLSSDTQDFVAATAPLFRKYNKSVARDKFITGATSGSRLLVLYRNGRVKAYGDWKRDGDLWVSNDYYQFGTRTFRSTVSTSTPSTSRYSSTPSYSDREYEEYSREYWDKYYDYSAYHDYSSGYHPEPDREPEPVNLRKQLTLEQADKVAMLWDKLLTEDYIEATAEDLYLLKRTADDYDEQNIWRDNYQYGYSSEEGYRYVWLEYGPADYGYLAPEKETEKEEKSLALQEHNAQLGLSLKEAADAAAAKMTEKLAEKKEETPVPKSTPKAEQPNKEELTAVLTGLA